MVFISEDWGIFEGDEWYAINNVWNKRDLVNGIDYSQTITVDTNVFPGGTSFNW